VKNGKIKNKLSRHGRGTTMVLNIFFGLKTHFISHEFAIQGEMKGAKINHG
jgi:hypothetical protein